MLLCDRSVPGSAMQVREHRRPKVRTLLAALQTRGNLARKNGFQARFSALAAGRFLPREAALEAERSLASLSR